MAFLAIPGFNAALTAAVSSGTGLFPIDPSVAATFAAQLGGSYTYASISDGVNFEIVQITSVSGADLVVVRAQDGTAASSFPTGSCIRYVWTVEGIAATAAGGSLVLTGTGAATATQTGPNAWTLDVQVPVITASLPIEVMGAYPAWEISFQGTYGACCCGGGSGGGSGGTITSITGSGLATVTGGTGPIANIGVLAPNFIAGTNMTSITGTWPNITFNATGGGGGGTVASVTGSTKILISGSGTNPVVNLVTTGIGGSSPYNGLTFDNWGCITAVNSSYVPITVVASTNPGVLVTTVGSTATFFIGNATTSQRGLALLAATTAVASANASDSTSAVTPAGLNAVLATLATPIAFSSYASASSGSYTNTLGTINVPAVAAGINVVITAAVSVTDSASVSPPTWGLAVFGGASLVQGVQAIYTGTHYLRFVVSGPLGATTYSLKTTALNGTTTVVAQEIDAMVLPI